MFVVPTLEELHTFLIALTKALFPDIDVSPSSFPALFGRTLAAAATDNHAHLVSVKADLLPDTAEGAALDRWGAVVGRPRKGATPARKADALRVVNNDVVAHDVTIGDELVHVSGLRFQINETISVPAGQDLDVDVVAIDTGSATRLAAGEVLKFTTPLAGIEEAAELQIALDEDGDDQEGDGAYRNRVLDRFRTPPLGGAQNDYETWALEVVGIATAYVYPNRAGLGTVDVAALHVGTGSARILNPGEVAELQAHLDEKRPIGATVRVLEVVEQAVDTEVTVRSTGEEAYAWDWIDETPLEVDAWNGGTRQLTFTIARPDTMAAGGRIVIRTVAGTGAGAPLVIESLVGADDVILEEVPDVAPVAGDLVYAGGALTDPVRAAVAAHIASLGTANPDDTSYGSWEGNLRTATLGGVVADVVGVRGLTLIAPAADVEADDPPFPGDAEINLLVPGRVLVRRRW